MQSSPPLGPAAWGKSIPRAMMTGVGVLLGTAAYMSPEQAKGREADKRSDIWAFGCLLYEMLSARRAFAGDDVSETIVACCEIIRTGGPCLARPRYQFGVCPRGASRRIFDVDFAISAKRESLSTKSMNMKYAVAADGRRFLLRRQVTEANRVPLTVVLNWPTLLAQ
jgi:serine/threonine protein kinase